MEGYKNYNDAFSHSHILSEQVTEQDLISEKAVIGCICFGDEYAHYIFGNIKQEHFYLSICQDMFAQLKNIWEKYGKVDNAMLTSQDNISDILFCMETVPSLSNYKRYVEVVIASYTKRSAAIVGIKLAEQGYDDINQAITELSNLGINNDNNVTFAMKDLIVDFYNRKKDNEKPEYIRVGIGLDKFIRLSRGDMFIIGARPSTGKTAIAIQMALNVSDKYHVAFFSLETSKEKIMDRIFSACFDVDYISVQDNEIDLTDEKQLKRLKFLNKRKISVIEAAGRTISWIMSEAVRIKADVIVIDYLSLVPGKGKSLHEIVTNNSMELHTGAQRNKILAIALSQLNRAGQGAPTLENLRESGQIEQDGDVIILLHRENPNQTDEQTKAIIAKNKTGSCGYIDLNFNKKTQMITALDDREE